MDALPEELLLDILSYLDRGPPSDARFFDEPSPLALARSHDQPVKALSLVSRRWRRITLPLLFQHQRLFLTAPVDAPTPGAYGHWLPSDAPQFSTYLAFLAKSELGRHLKGLVVCTAVEIEPGRDQKAQNEQDSDRFWTAIFSHVEPISVKIAAPPSTLAAIAGVWGSYQDAWAYDQQCHILELRQDPKSVYRSHHGVNHELHPRSLMEQRRWCHIGYNEGSSLEVYSLYEYQHYVSPIILPLLLQKVQYDVSSYTYVAIFPVSENVRRLARTMIPMGSCGKNIRLQLAPEPVSDILHDPWRMKRAQPADLWIELNQSYRLFAEMLSLGDEEASVESRDYRWPSLVATLDDSGHFGMLKSCGWTKVSPYQWSKAASQEHGSTPSSE